MNLIKQLCAGGLSPYRAVAMMLIAAIITCLYAVPPRTTGKMRPESFTRPKPTKPIVPAIPSIDRNRADKFFLERADELIANEEVDSSRQVVKGNVMFRKAGMVMYCDSAYYYPGEGSLDAFGNVRMLQGDTIEVKADEVSYNGIIQLAKLRTRSARQVVLEHTSKADKTKKFLYTDSLDYDLRSQMAYYDRGGRLINRSLTTGAQDTLTSVMGEYSTATKLAEVRDNVYLRNRTSRLRTNRLLYHTDSQIVDIVEPTTIKSSGDSISTSSGHYNTATGNATLNSRSFIAHRDTAGRVTTLEGDSIVYDNMRRVSEAFMFRNPLRRPAPMVINDTARKMILIGGYGYYNDSTKEAYADIYPLLKEYSQPDTIFLRADKIVSQTFNYGVKSSPLQKTDSAALDSADTMKIETEYHVAKAFPKARVFRRDIQGIADSITFNSADSMLFLNRKPIVWSGERMVAGTEIIVHFNDSAADWAELPRKGLMAEAIEEGFYNQLRANKIKAFLENNTLSRLDANTDVQTIFLPMENDSTYNKLVNAEGDSLSIILEDKKMDKLKLWSTREGEVTGAVMPIFVARPAQYYLNEFIRLAGASRYSEMEQALKELESLRPTYDWYKNGWEDGLGELSFALEEYFIDPERGYVDEELPPRSAMPPGDTPPADAQPDEESDTTEEGNGD